MPPLDWETKVAQHAAYHIHVYKLSSLYGVFLRFTFLLFIIDFVVSLVVAVILIVSVFAVVAVVVVVVVAVVVVVVSATLFPFYMITVPVAQVYSDLCNSQTFQKSILRK